MISGNEGMLTADREISFAMGRPDTLGADPYHNRCFPLIRGDGAEHSPHPEPTGTLDPPYCVIIKEMVDFSRITRKICLGIYLQDNTLTRTVELAFHIEQDLEHWIGSLPKAIRPQTGPSTQPETLKSVKEPQWVKRQKLVLMIRTSCGFPAFRRMLDGAHCFQGTSTSESFSSAPSSSPRHLPRGQAFLSQQRPSRNASTLQSRPFKLFTKSTSITTSSTPGERHETSHRSRCVQR